ncbi:MAG: glycosyltransferase family 2 protein [Bdellovibrionota bacterium]
MSNQLLSIVIPIYNEELVIAHLHEKMERFRVQFPMPMEIILVDDGSTDRSPALLKRWEKNARSVFVTTLPKNSGHQAALQAGLDQASGDYVITMDADLQDPIETIADLVEKSREGFDIVHAQRLQRDGEGTFRLAGAWMFYRLLHMLDSKALHEVGDFRLLTRNAHRHYLKSGRRIFMRGETIHLPFPQAVIGYKRHPRFAGKSKFSLRKLFALAWMGFRSSSVQSTAADQANETSPAS